MQANLAEELPSLKALIRVQGERALAAASTQTRLTSWRREGCGIRHRLLASTVSQSRRICLFTRNHPLISPRQPGPKQLHHQEVQNRPDRQEVGWAHLVPAGRRCVSFSSFRPATPLISSRRPSASSAPRASPFTHHHSVLASAEPSSLLPPRPRS